MRFSIVISVLCGGFLFLGTSCRSKKAVAPQTYSHTAVVENKKVPPSEKAREQNIVESKKTNSNKLQNFIAEWQGVTYKYGGADKKGIDCSHLAIALYADVYKKVISGPAYSIEQGTATIPMENIQEGDLVFFKIESKKVSHVGVYIGNNKFIHASTKKGVMVSDLSEPYYKKYFYKAGRVK
ncbi:MAG: C40 family peptidase [Bacteroidetes bacterium]|nr:C40 family peptidase [Bacteroidota bacterium]